MDHSLGALLSGTECSRRAQDAWFDETLKLLTVFLGRPHVFVIPSGTRNPSRAEMTETLVIAF